jgi:hypothetical protein
MKKTQPNQGSSEIRSEFKKVLPALGQSFTVRSKLYLEVFDEADAARPLKEIRDYRKKQQTLTASTNPFYDEGDGGIAANSSFNYCPLVQW